MAEALLLMGGNVGEVRRTLERAVGLLAEQGVRVVARSRLHTTAPWGGVDQPDFLNQALVVDTALAPGALLAACLEVERQLGRQRDPALRYGPRTIDIDILLYGERVVQEPGLGIPHPLFHERLFALAPAADVAPGWRHPVMGRSVLEMLAGLQAASTP